MNCFGGTNICEDNKKRIESLTIEFVFCYAYNTPCFDTRRNGIEIGYLCRRAISSRIQDGTNEKKKTIREHRD